MKAENSTGIAPPAAGRLLAVCVQEDLARSIEQALRNASIPISVVWISDVLKLSEQLKEVPPDLIVCDEDCARAGPGQVISCRDRTRPGLPVIRITRSHTIEAASAALVAGASELCSPFSRAGMEHLQQVVLRELSRYRQLRALSASEGQLKDAAGRYQRIASSTTDAWLLVREGIVTETNSAFARLAGRPDPEEVIGHPLADLVAPAARPALKQGIRKSMRGHQDENTIALKLETSAGETEVSARLLPVRDETEQVFELLIAAPQIIQITAPSAVAPAPKPEPAPDPEPEPEPERLPPQPPPQELEVAHDPAIVSAPEDIQEVNQSPNSAPKQPSFNLLDLLVVPPQESRLCMVMLVRLDGFDSLERRIGPFGARSIADKVCEAIAEKFRPLSSIHGFSADEWAFVFQHSSLDAIHGQAEDVVRDLGAQVYETRQHEAQVTLSIGIDLCGVARDPEEVLRELTGEVRKISASGGNRAALVGAAARTSREETEISQRTRELQKTLDENRLKLSYHTLTSLEGESVRHYDVSLRMLDETGSESDTERILSGALDAGLRRRLDQWSVKRTLATIGRQYAIRPGSCFFVRLSEETLKNNEPFVQWFLDQTGHAAVHRKRVVFELPETILQNHVGKAQNLQSALQTAGTKLSIGQFGSSEQTLRLLEAIPASFIRIDSGKLADDRTKKHWLDLVEAARQKKAVTIASQVSDARQLANLWQMGINFYHDGRAG